MNGLVAALRLSGAACALLGIAVTSGAACLLPRGAARCALLAASLRAGCHILLRALGVTPMSRGPRPMAGSLIVANHLSWIDIPAALSLWPCTFVAKSEVRRWPLIGRIGDALGVIWIDRRRPRDLVRVIPQVEDALRRGRSVLLFPEGTTTDGREVLPFRSGLFEAAIRARAPVTAVAFSVSASGGDADALCWYGTETLLANIVRIAGLRGARCTLHVTAPIDHHHDRKTQSRAARDQTVRRARWVRRQAVSARAKQNFRPIESSEREIFA